MKSVLVLFFCFQLVTSFSKERIELKAAYEIVSDQFDSKIPTGSYMVDATVYDFQTKRKLSGIQIQFPTKEKTTDSKGWFRLTVPLSDFFFSLNSNNYPTAFCENYTIKNRHHLKMKIFLLDENHYNEPDVAEKPVIYCYSEKPIHFDLKLNTVGQLAFAYPPLNAHRTWNMHLENNALTDTQSHQKYPYLFWESEQDNVHFKAENSHQNSYKLNAFIVSKSTIVKFLDSTLTAIGFNSQEKTDFITYWGPRMQASNFYLIQFLQNNACETISTYEINPTPAHLNRFYMLFMESETNNFPYITTPQQLKPFKRNGFYMVDWGGIELKNTLKLTP